MLNRLLLAVAAVLVLSVATAAPDVSAHHGTSSLVPNMEIDAPIVDIRCDGYAAVMYTLKSESPFPPGANGATLWLATQNMSHNRQRHYGHLDGVVRAPFTDLLSTTFNPVPPGTVIRWQITTWWYDPQQENQFYRTGHTEGTVICSSLAVPSDRVAVQVNWHDYPRNNAAVRIWDSSTSWQETTWADEEAGWTNFYIPGYDGRPMWLQVCIQEGEHHWITRPGPYRPTPELMRPDGTFVIPLVLDGLSGEQVSNGWCDHPIDWSRYN